MSPAVAPNAPATVLCLPDSRDLAFAEYGDPEGVPVIAFHGTPGSRLQLAPADAAARDAGVRLIVPDRPGYGHSTFARGRGLDDWPADVVAVADHLAVDRFAVLGISGGGPHALACASAVPNRVTAAGVVSSPSPQSNGPLRWITAVPALVWAVVALLVVVMRRFPLAALGLARRWMPDADRRVVDDAGFRSYFIDAARRTSPTTARAVAQDVALFARDWRFSLHDIEVVVKIWHGADDRLVEPWNAEVLAKSIPGSSIAVVDDEGHLLFAERADDILRELAEMTLSHEGLVAHEAHRQ